MRSGPGVAIKEESGARLVALLLADHSSHVLNLDAFYGAETNIHNVDAMTDVSTPFTAFTRYTVAPSLSSQTSK